MLGTVTNIFGDIFQVEFPDSLTDYDKNVDRWSTSIAPAGQKTTEDYEWRCQNLRDCVNYEVDAFDGNTWLMATIFNTKKEMQTEGREVEMGYVAYRVYRNIPNVR